VKLTRSSREFHELNAVIKALFILGKSNHKMIDFLSLSLTDKILVALAVLKNNKSHEEVTKWVNKMVKHFTTNKEANAIKKEHWSEGRIQFYMSQMLKKRYGKQRECVLDLQKIGRKFTYKSGKYTVNSRLGALVIFLLWKIYTENNYSLTEDQAVKIAENNEDEISSILKDELQVKGNYKWENIKWLMDEIKNENSSVGVLDWKFDSILKADYFRRVRLPKKVDKTGQKKLEENESPKLVEPTDRLTMDEKDYIESLIYLLPELEAIEDQHRTKEAKAN